MVKLLFLSISIPFLTAISTSCSKTISTRSVDTVSNIAISEVGQDAGGEICAGFSLNTEQVKDFFEQARIISAKESHDAYDYLPCFVKGSLTRNQQRCDFTIRAGATAQLICDDGAHDWLACDVCEAMFIAN